MLTKRMAMRRMNEMCRRMALTLVFYALLFHTCQGQDVSTTGITTSQASANEEPISTQKSPGDQTDISITTPTNSPSTDDKVTHHPDIISQGTLPESTGAQRHTAVTDESLTSLALETIVTAEPITSEPAVTLDHISSTNNFSDNYAENDNQSQQQVNKAGVGISQPTQSEPTPVFVPILVCGLILAAVLIGVYVWKNHFRRKPTGMKLTEESYMSDEVNQGNTLVSVAPLNPPENQEKPSQNGESLEAVKTQNPPAATNGHSTTKADTEL